MAATFRAFRHRWRCWHGTLLGVPVPLILFGIVALIWHIMLRRSRHGFSVYMVGSNIRATEYSGIDTKRTLVKIYALSGCFAPSPAS